MFSEAKERTIADCRDNLEIPGESHWRGHRSEPGAACTGARQGEGLNARFIEGDAEALPFEDADFDVVTSLVGAMFAPRPELVARELLRVCSPGGTIAMGNWTREGFVGQMFQTFAKFIAPSGMPAPVLWGDETVVRERLGHGVSDLKMAAPLQLHLPLPAD